MEKTESTKKDNQMNEGAGTVLNVGAQDTTGTNSQGSTAKQKDGEGSDLVGVNTATNPFSQEMESSPGDSIPDAKTSSQDPTTTIVEDQVNTAGRTNTATDAIDSSAGQPQVIPVDVITVVGSSAQAQAPQSTSDQGRANSSKIDRYKNFVIEHKKKFTVGGAIGAVFGVAMVITFAALLGEKAIGKTGGIIGVVTFSAIAMLAFSVVALTLFCDSKSSAQDTGSNPASDVVGTSVTVNVQAPQPAV